MNKKILGMVTLIAFLIIAIPSVLATTTTVNWSGAGIVNIVEQSEDDFYSQMNTAGNTILGTYTLTDLENNPYGYGVDNVLVELRASFDNGGSIYFENQRQDSWVPMYGTANEISWTLVTSDDAGTIDFRTGGNYASLTSANYGWQTNDQFTASGNFYVEHQLWDGDEGGYLFNVGSGTTDIDFMTETTWGTGESFTFGSGGGSYTNAAVTATGSGYFELYGQADNILNVGMLPFSIGGDGTPASASFTVSANYGSGLTILDISFDGN